MKKGITKAELTELLKRTQAEFENYRKRNEAEFRSFAESASLNVIQKLLPVLDNFELALKTEGHDDLLKGFEMIYSQFKTLLESEGLEEITTNKIFNPEIHEAILTQKSKEPEGTILEVFQKGYKIKDKILRHARVKVAKC